MLHGNTLTFNL